MLSGWIHLGYIHHGKGAPEPQGNADPMENNPSPLILDEYFDRQDDRFVEALRLTRASGESAALLALIFTECPRRIMHYDKKTYHVAAGPRALPQGACTSPAVGNMVVRKLEARPDGPARKLGWTYTRYADDMTFSADRGKRGELGYLPARVRHITADEGFKLNHAETRVLERDTSQTVTGIVVNDRPGVPGKRARRIRAILHRAQREGLESQNRIGHPHFASWVQGMISYIRMVNACQGADLQEKMNNIR